MARVRAPHRVIGASARVMSVRPVDVCEVLWAAVGLVWLVGALRTKRTQEGEALLGRLSYLAPVGLAALVMSIRPPSPLDVRLVDAGSSLPWVGVALTALGVSLAIFARVYLGANWSGRVTFKEQHELVVRGPYALVRHPIYSGLLLAAAGTVLAIGRAMGGLGVAMLAVSFWIKLRREERLLEQHFPGYAQYRGRVKALVPFLL